MSLDFFFLTNECVELAPFINVLRSLARKEDTVRKGFTIFLDTIKFGCLWGLRAYPLGIGLLSNWGLGFD